MGNYWLQFDDAYVKTKLICNWPEVKKEHNEISQDIKGVIMKYLFFRVFLKMRKMQLSNFEIDKISEESLIERDCKELGNNWIYDNLCLIKELYFKVWQKKK